MNFLNIIATALVFAVFFGILAAIFGPKKNKDAD